MGKTRKKSSQSGTIANLKKGDYELVCNFLVKISSRLQLLIDDMKLSKKPSKPFLKSTKGKGLAGMFLLFRTDLGHAGNRSPKDINKSMAMNLRMQYPSEDISDDLLIEEYIPSKRLSEVLQVLEETGLFSHIKNKKDIKKIMGCRRVKLEGRPALYIIPNKIIESNKFLSRPEIRNVIMKHLMDTRLLHKFINLLIRGFYQFVTEASEKQLYDGFRSVTDIDSDKIANIVKTYSNIKFMLLSSSDKKIIDVIAKESTNEFLKNITKDKSNFLKRMLLLLYQLKFE